MTRKRIGGVPKLVKIITSSELVENGGQFMLSSKIALPVIVDETITRVMGGPVDDRVYIVSQDEIDSGAFKVLGGPAVPVADSTIVTPARLESSGRGVTPVFVVSGSLGGPGFLVDDSGEAILFDTGEPYVFADIPDLTSIDVPDMNPAEDFAQVWDKSQGKAKKVLMRNFGAGVGQKGYAYFQMTKNATQATTNNVWAVITWQVATHDSHSGVDLGSNKYTIPVGQGGLWMFFLNVRRTDRWYYARNEFRIDGVLTYGLYYSSSNADNTADHTNWSWWLGEVSDGEDIDTRGYWHQNGTITSGFYDTFLAGYRIRP